MREAVIVSSVCTAVGKAGKRALRTVRPDDLGAIAIRGALARVPRSWFLDQMDTWPADLENYVLKPLFSFAGLGVIVGPTRADLDAILPEKRHEYLLQQRMRFEPVIATPHGATQAEFRIMFLWADELKAGPVIVRMGRGKMMGVDHNRDLEWVGASAALFSEP